MAKIHPTAVVGKNVQLAEDVVIGPLSVVGDGVSIGAGTVLDAHVVIADRVTIGQGNRLYPNCVIGCCPQVLGFDPGTKIGTLVIGDRNVIRENVTIHPSRYEDASTQIGSDNLIMVGTHIGHDCIIENQIVLSNSVQVGGHGKIEEGAWVSGVAGMHQFVTVGRWCFVAGLAGLTHDAPPYMMVSGHYPSCVRGVNKRGLHRAGLDEQQQERIFEAYHRLYREGTPLLVAARALAREDGLDANVRLIVDAILRSGEHRFGRYLESLRR
ncbi:MAG: acyl-ACP--UDP-N-acetylglucosamine O-acyltransferase [Phycisphaerae bacterium]|nr:acyl-ACP--UDP-N-acetylglucosamine O-acyltransferase [Phycisphaerae bacterium]